MRKAFLTFFFFTFTFSKAAELESIHPSSYVHQFQGRGAGD